VTWCACKNSTMGFSPPNFSKHARIQKIFLRTHTVHPSRGWIFPIFKPHELGAAGRPFINIETKQIYIWKCFPLLFLYIISKMLSFNKDTKVILPSSLSVAFTATKWRCWLLVLLYTSKTKKSSLKSRANSFPGDKHERASCMFVFA
jgi:hypothetical protein